jgi:ethanolaminephosphotransferase
LALGGRVSSKNHGVPIVQLQIFRFNLVFTLRPNLVTVIGFLFILVSYLVTTYYVPVLFGEAPRWVYFMNALFLFIYQTMDALDGKQARRTASSSPLGELVDHGCDAICMTVMTLTLGASVSIGTDPVWVTCYMLIASMAGFYAAQWEEYHTGVLELGYFNVTEGLS